MFTATYAQPGGMRAGFAQFTAFSQDAKDNQVFEQVKLTTSVLAVGGEKPFGPTQAVIMRHVAKYRSGGDRCRRRALVNGRAPG
ncbi:MAG: hypothetical protein WBX22_05110 [Silvibacterium sp.]